ncbi:YdcF family protein [Bacillus sp. 31A1R]|uniref:YdcF family protein n=1 Tax=Robertmurraya mangrovi TaxID=3098077 RepID=A0ABU5J334_9BACI|nr:YdcF family protein [Bacillus sp. 31A1R]MDZ5473813.1 YdcF family protein [Bacillus sp. 31A1R]
MKKYLLLILFLSPIIMISIFHYQIKKTAKTTPPSDVPYIIVLGAKVNGEVMSLSLLNRANKALEYLNENPNTKVITTGGQGPGEDITESSALKAFFIENGIDETRILEEDLSTSTYENLRFTKNLYDVHEAVIVSNDFHLYRSIELARKVGIKGHPLAAETPAIVRVNLYLREYAAILKMKIVGT